MRKGNLFVISGPSGVGKGTLVACLLDEVEDTWLSVSATTRKPRPGDVEGVTYRFMSKRAFTAMVKRGGFLEWAEYSGNYYGTPRDAVEEHIANGDQVILEIEVQGALQIREAFPEAHLIFIEPPSMEELERRLRGRGTDSEDAIIKRLETARVELSHKMEYDFRLVNDNLEVAVRELVEYVDKCAEENEGFEQ